MAKLILSMDGLVLKEIPLIKDRLTIGRRPYNDVQIDNLAVSGEHAAVVTILNDSFLEDLNSTNGTLVNGQSVKKHFLKNGDVIEFSKYKLKYFVDVPSPTHGTEFETDGLVDTEVLKFPSSHESDTQSMPHAPAPKPRNPEPIQKSAFEAGKSSVFAAAPDVAEVSLPPAAIRLLSGASTGRQLELTRPMTSLGKHGVQVAVVARKPRGYFIMPSEGSRFPEVNGQVMDVYERLLEDHDVIDLAGIKMEFFLKP